MKLILLLALFAIVVSLGLALRRLNRAEPADRSATVRALTWRIGLSLLLFLFILLAIRLGWITPHGVAG